MTDYNVMKYTLEKIATVNAMDYEYQAWAREALAQQSVQQKPLTDEQQIAEALRAHGLTLVKTESGYKVLKLGQITALDNQPTPPSECQTDAEKTAFAFGWWKALEHIRMKKTNQYSDIVSDGGMDPRK